MIAEAVNAYQRIEGKTESKQGNGTVRVILDSREQAIDISSAPSVMSKIFLRSLIET